MWFLFFAFLMLVLVFGRLVGSISRINILSETHIRVAPLLGKEMQIPLSDILDLRVFTLGILTHALIRIRSNRFLSLGHTQYIVPVRGRFMDQQGPLRAVWNKVPSSTQRML